MPRGGGDTGAIARVPSGVAGASGAASQRPVVVARPRPPIARTPPRSRRDGRAAPPTDAYRDDVGCATWLIGSAILLGIVGLVVLAFKLGPNVFQESANDPLPTATVTVSSAAGSYAVAAADDRSDRHCNRGSSNGHNGGVTHRGVDRDTRNAACPIAGQCHVGAGADRGGGRQLDAGDQRGFQRTVAQGLIIRQDPPRKPSLDAVKRSTWS